MSGGRSGARGDERSGRYDRWQNSDRRWNGRRIEFNARRISRRRRRWRWWMRRRYGHGPDSRWHVVVNEVLLFRCTPDQKFLGLVATIVHDLFCSVTLVHFSSMGHDRPIKVIIEIAGLHHRERVADIRIRGRLDESDALSGRKWRRWRWRRQ